MKLKVTVTFRDDKEQTFLCSDFPYVGPWVTIYCEGFTRHQFPQEAIKDIKQEFVEDPKAA